MLSAGEVSFLSGASRITTTVAKTDCLVMVMSRMGFLKSMKVVPEVAVKILEKERIVADDVPEQRRRGRQARSPTAK